MDCKYCGIANVHLGTGKCTDSEACFLRCEVSELKSYLHNIDECLDEFSSGFCSVPPRATEADVYPAVRRAIKALRSQTFAKALRSQTFVKPVSPQAKITAIGDLLKELKDSKLVGAEGAAVIEQMETLLFKLECHLFGF
jgi:hypothetical protein